MERITQGDQPDKRRSVPDPAISKGKNTVVRKERLVTHLRTYQDEEPWGRISVVDVQRACVLLPAAWLASHVITRARVRTHLKISDKTLDLLGYNQSFENLLPVDGEIEKQLCHSWRVKAPLNRGELAEGKFSEKCGAMECSVCAGKSWAVNSMLKQCGMNVKRKTVTSVESG